MAAIGIAQLATGPQKCVLKKKNVIYVISNAYIHDHDPYNISNNNSRERYNHHLPHKIVTGFFALENFHKTVHLEYLAFHNKGEKLAEFNKKKQLNKRLVIL